MQIRISGTTDFGHFLVHFQRYSDFPKGRRNIPPKFENSRNFFFLGLRMLGISVEIGEKYHSVSGPSKRFL